LQLRPHNNKVRGRISHLTTLNQFHASFIFEWWRITYYILERREKEWLWRISRKFRMEAPEN